VNVEKRRVGREDALIDHVGEAGKCHRQEGEHQVFVGVAIEGEEHPVQEREGKQHADEEDLEDAHGTHGAGLLSVGRVHVPGEDVEAGVVALKSFVEVLRAVVGVAQRERVAPWRERRGAEQALQPRRRRLRRLPDRADREEALPVEKDV
jgi:hypothetical protein